MPKSIKKSKKSFKFGSKKSGSKTKRSKKIKKNMKKISKMNGGSQYTVGLRDYLKSNYNNIFDIEYQDTDDINENIKKLIQQIINYDNNITTLKKLVINIKELANQNKGSIDEKMNDIINKKNIDRKLLEFLYKQEINNVRI